MGCINETTPAVSSVASKQLRHWKVLFLQHHPWIDERVPIPRQGSHGWLKTKYSRAMLVDSRMKLINWDTTWSLHGRSTLQHFTRCRSLYFNSSPRWHSAQIMICTVHPNYSLLLIKVNEDVLTFRRNWHHSEFSKLNKWKNHQQTSLS